MTTNVGTFSWSSASLRSFFSIDFRNLWSSFLFRSAVELGVAGRRPRLPLQMLRGSGCDRMAVVL